MPASFTQEQQLLSPDVVGNSVFLLGVNTIYSAIMRGGAGPRLGEVGRLQTLARISRFILTLISDAGKCISQFEKTPTQSTEITFLLK